MVKTDCYWYEEWKDMNATFPCCKLTNNDILDSCDGCKEYHSKYHTTNADKIRHMNDEELASFLMHPRSMCPQWDCDTCPEDNWCESCVLAWLKKEYEDGEEE